MNSIPERKDVPVRDTWELSSLYPDDASWNSSLAELETAIPRVAEFKGTLGKSSRNLAKALEYIVNTLGQLEERLGYYVMLRQSENLGDGKVQGLYARYMNVATKLGAEMSWMEPEILAIDDKVMQSFLEDRLLAEFKVYLSKLLRFKPHILSGKEENLLAKQIESSQVPPETFSALTNADMEFGTVHTSKGDEPLTQSTYSSLLLNSDRRVREEAYRKFYRVFKGHKNTLGSLLAGSILRDKYLAEVRGYPSALAKALYRDNISMD
ncbi:MAG: hypothetical protein B6D68_03370, partial [spirochete symbiont of Stewartia floridana]